jgi:hypothetical protein
MTNDQNRQSRNEAALEVNKVFRKADVRAINNIRTFQALVQLCINNRVRYDLLIEKLGTKVSRMSRRQVCTRARDLRI